MTMFAIKRAIVFLLAAQFYTHASAASLLLQANDAHFQATGDLEIAVIYTPSEMDARGLGAYDITLEFDSQHWSVPSVDFGLSLSPNGLSGIQFSAFPSSYHIQIAEVSFDSPEDLISTQRGSLSLARLKFKKKTNAFSTFKIDEALISDAFGDAISLTSPLPTLMVGTIPEPNSGVLLVMGLLVCFTHNMLATKNSSRCL